MFLLINDKLYAKDGDVYKSIDIINTQVIFNGIEEKQSSENGQLLDYKEVYAKFNINPSMPQLSMNYNFPQIKPKTKPKNENVEQN